MEDYGIEVLPIRQSKKISCLEELDGIAAFFASEASTNI
jgi:hypothetical protein